MSLLYGGGVLAGEVRWQDELPPEARKHFDQAVRLYNIQQYDRAADEFRAAYLIDPQPKLLYSLAQAERLGGDCEQAIDGYKAFLRTNPGHDAAKLAADNIDACERELAATGTHTTTKIDVHRADVEKGTKAGGDNTVQGPNAGDAHEGAARNEAGTSVGGQGVRSGAKVGGASPWYSDIWGGVLAGASVASLGVAGAFYGIMSNELKAAKQADTYETFGAHRQATERARTVSIGCAVAGGAFAAAAVVRYILATPSASKVSVTLVPQVHGTGLGIAGVF